MSKNVAARQTLLSPPHGCAAFGEGNDTACRREVNRPAKIFLRTHSAIGCKGPAAAPFRSHTVLTKRADVAPRPLPCGVVRSGCPFAGGFQCGARGCGEQKAEVVDSSGQTRNLGLLGSCAENSPRAGFQVGRRFRSRCMPDSRSPRPTHFRNSVGCPGISAGNRRLVS